MQRMEYRDDPPGATPGGVGAGDSTGGAVRQSSGGDADAPHAAAPIGTP